MRRVRHGTRTVQQPLFVLFVAIAATATALVSVSVPLRSAVLVGFDAAAIIFLVACTLTLGRASAAGLRRSAARNDAGRILLLATAAIILATVLIVVGMELRHAAAPAAGELALISVTLLLAWGFGNAVFAIHYAHMYYDPTEGADRGGLDFPGRDEPDFWDFLYFACVLGMTFQVSDVAITRRAVRRVATFHALVAFLFNIGIVALTVNMVAGSSGIRGD